MKHGVERHSTALFFGRKDDRHSETLLEFLRAKFAQVTALWSENPATKLDENACPPTIDFIFCFRSYFILGPNLLNRAKIAAVNFHPGPPEYRGIGCVNFALLAEARSYGSTAHVMDKHIDNGPILDVVRFSVADDDSLKEVLAKTHASMLEQALRVVDALWRKKKEGLQELAKKSAGDKWSGPVGKRADLENLYRLPVPPEEVDAASLERIIRATSIDQYQPYFEIHGRKFVLARGEQ